MSVATKFPMPPTLRGTTEDQLKQIWRFLFQLVQILNKGAKP